MCKHGDVFSLRVLIGRGLDLLLPRSSNYSFSLRLIQFSGFYPKVGVDYDEDPPVPIPNTEVKLTRADNTRRAASREDRSMPLHKKERLFSKVVLFLSIEQTI